MTSLFDHPIISSRYFFPRYERPRDVVHIDVGDAILGCSRHITHPDAPWIVHFHGNGEVVADYESDLAPLFQAAGFNVFLAEYRGYGASTGTPSMVKMLDDVPKVLAFIGAPLENMIVYGRSVGSLYAIEAAYRAPQLRGLVIESGIASPLERILYRVRPDELGVTPEALAQAAKERLDHETKLACYPGQTLVLHAKHDTMVDRNHAERNARWAQHAELVLYEHGDHNDIVNLNVTDIVKRVARLAGRT
jgi:pimeloyl-ACP methyl ester carboxylesterase